MEDLIMALPENIARMQATQDVAQSDQKFDDLALMKLMSQSRGGSNVPPPVAGNQGMPMTPPSVVASPDVKQNLNEVLTATLPDGDSIATKALENLVNKANVNVVSTPSNMVPTTGEELNWKNVPSSEGWKRQDSDEYSMDEGLPIAAAPAIAAALENQVQAAHGGGLMRLAVNNEFSGQVPGRGHGMQDNVYMPIVERKAGDRIGTLAVSPDEYVVDAHTMSALGNGSADAGAEVMDTVVKNVREKAYGTTQQPNEISGLAALKPMMERV